MNLPLANGRYRKPAEVLAGFIVSTSVAVWLLYLYVYFQYDATRPRQFSLLSGRIYAQNNHGHIVYLTKAEDMNLTYLMLIASGLMGVAFLVVNLFVATMRWNRPSPALVHEHRRLYGKGPAPWEKKQW